MVLIVGIATAASGALVLYRRMTAGAFGEPNDVVRMVRQTTGVVLAVANFIRSALDALQLIRRPAVATATATGSRIIGSRAGEDD